MRISKFLIGVLFILWGLSPCQATAEIDLIGTERQLSIANGYVRDVYISQEQVAWWTERIGPCETTEELCIIYDTFLYNLTTDTQALIPKFSDSVSRLFGLAQDYLVSARLYGPYSGIYVYDISQSNWKHFIPLNPAINFDYVYIATTDSWVAWSDDGGPISKLDFESGDIEAVDYSGFPHPEEQYCLHKDAYCAPCSESCPSECGPSPHYSDQIAASGNLLVYRLFKICPMASGIYGYDFSDKSHFLVTDSGSYPAIDGRVVVYQKPGNNSVYMKDLDGEESPIATNPVFDLSFQRIPHIKNDWIVWREKRHDSFDIFAFDLLSQVEFRLTDSPLNRYMGIGGIDNETIAYHTPTYLPEFNDVVYTLDIPEISALELINRLLLQTIYDALEANLLSTKLATSWLKLLERAKLHVSTIDNTKAVKIVDRFISKVEKELVKGGVDEATGNQLITSADAITKILRTY